MRLIGIEQRRTKRIPNTFFAAMMRPIRVIMKPTVFVSCLYYCLTFAWVVGINTTLSIFIGPLYGFGPKQIGFFYFTPIVAALLGEGTGHFLHDYIARSYIRSHGGHFEPEVRLRAIWLSTPFMLSGLILMGFCLQRGYHYMITSLSWGLYVFGIMITTVSLNAYNLDSYPEGSGEVAAWINMSVSYLLHAACRLTHPHIGRGLWEASSSPTSRLNGHKSRERSAASEHKQPSVSSLSC